MSEPVIGIDFDHTCFDTADYTESGLENLAYDGEIDEARTEYGAFKPEEFAKLTDNSMEEVEDTLSNAADFLYNEAEEVIQQMPGEVVIVTRGLEGWQSSKVEKSGLLDYADRCEVVDGPLANNPKSDTGIDYLIDNREAELQTADLPSNRTFHVDQPDKNLRDAYEAVKQEFQ